MSTLNAVKTYKDLQDAVLLKLADAGASQTLRDLVKASITENHERRVTSQQWSFMRYTPPPLTLVAGVKRYSLHEAFGTPLYFRSRTTGRPLVERPADMLASYEIPEVTATGEAERFTFGGSSGLRAQPTTNGVVRIVSTNSGDAGKTVTVCGETADGYEEETITCNGLTPVDGEEVFLAGQLLTIRKNGSGWSGTLTATADSGATTLVKLPAAVYGRTYRVIELETLPTGAEIIDYPFYRRMRQLSDANDLPDIPAPHSNILIYDALLDLQGFSRATAGEIARWQELQQLQNFNLENEYLDGQTLGAEASYGTYIPR